MKRKPGVRAPRKLVCLETYWSDRHVQVFRERSVRPAKDRKGGNYLGKYPASTKVKHRPVDPAAQALLVAAVGKIPPEKR